MRLLSLTALMLPSLVWASSVQVAELEAKAFTLFSRNSGYEFSDNSKVIFPSNTVEDITSGCSKPIIKSVSSARRKLSSAKVAIRCQNGVSIVTRATVQGKVKVQASSGFNKKDTPLNIARFEPIFMSVSDVRGNVFLGDVSDEAFTLKNNMKPNEVLTTRDLKRTEDIEKNAKITAFIETKGITIKMDAIALKGGVIGEEIPVKNANSGKKFLAVVHKKNQVQVVK